MDPVTLNLLLREEMNVITDGLVSKDTIIQALELTKRPINKRAVYRDLETILAHEIHLGYLVKRADNSFLLASINKDKHYRGTIPLKSSKRKPKPSRKYLEMESELQRNKPDKYSEYVSFDAEGNFPLYFANGINPGPKSEEELKDDLIKEKLITSNLLKMKSKMKSGKAKTKKENTSPIAPSPAVEIIPVKVENSFPEEGTTLTLQDEKKALLLPAKPNKFKKEAWQVSITVKESKPKVSIDLPELVINTPKEVKEQKEEVKVMDVKKEEQQQEEEEEDEEKEEEDEEEDEELEAVPEEPVDLKPRRAARKRRMYAEESEEELIPDTVPPPSETITRTLSGRKKVRK